jgi:hypothetical protein
MVVLGLSTSEQWSSATDIKQPSWLMLPAYFSMAYCLRSFGLKNAVQD